MIPKEIKYNLHYGDTSYGHHMALTPATDE